MAVAKNHDFADKSHIYHAVNFDGDDLLKEQAIGNDCSNAQGDHQLENKFLSIK